MKPRAEIVWEMFGRIRGMRVEIDQLDLDRRTGKSTVTLHGTLIGEIVDLTKQSRVQEKTVETTKEIGTDERAS